MTTVAGAVLVAAALAAAASAQITLDGETVSASDVRPLMKVAEYVTTRYGIPVAYEDLPASAYSAGLPPASTVRFRAPDLPFNTAWPSDATKVAMVLREMLEQNAGIGNVGRFRVLTTAAGLVIAPNEPTILDARISFAEARIGFPTFETFGAALRAASGRPLMVGYPMDSAYHTRISADNEIARDVLVELLNGLHRTLGIRSEMEGVDPETTYTWDLTSDSPQQPACETPPLALDEAFRLPLCGPGPRAGGASHLRFRWIANVYRAPVLMEKAPR